MTGRWDKNVLPLTLASILLHTAGCEKLAEFGLTKKGDSSPEVKSQLAMSATPATNDNANPAVVKERNAPVSAVVVTNAQGHLSSADIAASSASKLRPSQEPPQKHAEAAIARFLLPSDPALWETTMAALQCRHMMPGLAIKADKVSLSYSGSYSDRDCYTEGQGPDKEGTESVELSDVTSSYHLACSSADFSAWDKKSPKDLLQAYPSIADITALCPAGDGYLLFHESTNKVRQRKDKGRLAESVLAGISTNEGKGCKFEVKDGAARFEDGCLSFWARTSTPGGPKLNANSRRDATVAVFKDVKRQGSAKFPDSGEVQLTVNEWQGMITFKGDRAPPHYTLTSPSQQVIKGSLGEGKAAKPY